MKSSTSVALSLLATLTLARSGDGSTCVDSQLIDMFNLINDLRAMTTSSTIYQTLVDAQIEYSAN